MEQKSLFSVISPIMVGPSSSHTAGAVRLGLMARNIYKNEFKKVKFVLYNSFAKTGFGHGTDKGLLAGVLGYSVDEICIKNIFDIVDNIEYSYEYREDISRHPNSVDIILDDKMTVSGDSVGAGEIRINNINGFSANIDGSYDTLLLMYKDVPGMISQVSDIIQKQKVNIASLHCDRSSKGGTASMYLALDIPVGDDVVNQVKQIKDVFFVTNIRKLK
ncbi:L-serine ammonia-lyase, iron-sulfur-dependent, subunit beta [bacterium]|nr:L-serine ammonia-lyase, iron-sulfur-dependent, subunit beta [bacterium]